jgi:hypothetical protein
MPTPGFSAASSLSPPQQRYANASFSAAVVPALTNGNGGGVGPNCPTFTPCDSNCMRTVHPCQGGSFSESCCLPGFRCESGTCVCPAPSSNCGTSCSNTQTDPNNCGSCGHSCNGSSCVGGACNCSSAGLTLCGGTCVNVQSDAGNCGSCGHQCIAGVPCVAGLCQCPQGQTWSDVQTQCNGAVRQITATLNGPPGGSASIDMCYCTLGPAGTLAASLTPDQCTQAHILGIAGSVTGIWNVPDSTCCTSQGLSVCGTSCKNLSSDPKNCAQCGRVCTTSIANAFPLCDNGVCTFDCDLGLAECSYRDGNRSFTVCCQPPANGIATCSAAAGGCSYVCNPGYQKCSSGCCSAGRGGGSGPGSLDATLFVNVGAAGLGNTPCTANVSWTLTSPGQPTQQKQISYNATTITNIGPAGVEATYCPAVQDFLSLAPGIWSLKANWGSGSLTCPGIKIASGMTTTYQLWSDSQRCLNVSL